MSLMSEPPKKRIKAIHESMIGSNFKNLRSTIYKNITGDIRQFTHKFNGHKWKGYIYLSRNSLMGTIFSYWDNIPIVIRGYPKIRYTEQTHLINEFCTCEEKIDGTNLGIFMLPNGAIMGKTRMVERWDLGGYKGRFWNKLFEKTGLLDSIDRVVSNDYIIYGELYGYENAGDFIRYSSSISFKGFDIVDCTDFSFLSPSNKYNLLNSLDIPVPDILFEGFITEKEIENLEFKLRSYVMVDGMEGLVAKHYDTITKDTYFAKIKTGSIQELAWSLSPKKSIPRGFIAKALRKAWENNKNFTKRKEILNFIEEELSEEFDPEFISRSGNKIKRMIDEYFTSMQGDIKPEVFDYLKGLEERGIDIDNKGKIMSSLSKLFTGYAPNKLYFMYLAYKNK